MQAGEIAQIVEEIRRATEHAAELAAAGARRSDESDATVQRAQESFQVIGVAVEADLAPLLDYQLVADQILVDAKAPKGALLPGGNGLTFDWRLLVGRKWLKPWMLAGGLTPDNVGQAIQRTGARQVDVASGVESAPGVKDPDRIAAFVEAAQGVKGGVPILR